MLVASCASDPGFDFEVKVDPGTSTVSVNGSEDYDQRLHATSYEVAKRSLMVEIVASDTSHQVVTEMLPGFCDSAVPDGSAEQQLGTLRLESLAIDIDSALMPIVTGATCVGDRSTFMSQQ